MPSVAYSTNVPVVVTVQQNHPVQQKHPGKKYSRPYTVLGVLQILIGVLGVMLSARSIGIIPKPTYTEQVWGTSGLLSPGHATGLSRLLSDVGYTVHLASSYSVGSSTLYLVAGTAGVAIGCNPSNCSITGALVVTIFAAIASGIMCLLESLTAVALNLLLTPVPLDLSPLHLAWVNEEKDLVTRELGIHAVLAILAGAQFIITIVLSGYCCAANCCAVNCCAKKSHSGMVTGGTTVMMQNPVQMQAQPAYDPSQAMGDGLGRVTS